MTTTSGRFEMRLQLSTGLTSLIIPHDAPPFALSGSSTGFRAAPVRAKVYSMVRKAFEQLSPERLLLLIRPPGE